MRQSLRRCLLPQCRCLTLLFIVLLTGLGATTVDGRERATLSTARLDRQQRGEVLGAGPPYLRRLRLYNMCSQANLRLRPVRLRRKRVDARGKANDPFAKLVMESAPPVPGGVRLRGEWLSKYLCFNRKGRLVLRHNGESLKCVFKESYEDGYTVLQSAAQPQWYVGFRKRKGKALPGFKAAKKLRRRCIRFLKVSLQSQEEAARLRQPNAGLGPLGGGQVDLDSLRHRFHPNARHRHRHQHGAVPPTPPPPAHSVGPLARPDVDFRRVQELFQGRNR